MPVWSQNRVILSTLFAIVFSTRAVVVSCLLGDIFSGNLPAPVGNARLILPALWFRGAGQGDPLALGGCDDNFSLHTALGKNELVQRAMVGRLYP